MAKGRKKIPSKIIDLRGGTKHTHRPPRVGEPTPPEKMPPCPDHLDEIAKKEWKRAGKILQSIGLLTELDMMILAAYCESYSRWVRATLETTKMGGLVSWDKTKGRFIRNPYINIACEAYDQMIRAGTQLGLSPSSRASLKVEKPKQKDDADIFLDACKK